MDDLISRSALLEVLENLRQRNPHSDARSRSQHNSEITSCIHRVIMQPMVDAVPVEVIQKLENPYSPIEYQDAFAGFETAKCQLLLKYGKKVQE